MKERRRQQVAQPWQWLLGNDLRHDRWWLISWDVTGERRTRSQEGEGTDSEEEEPALRPETLVIT